MQFQNSLIPVTVLLALAACNSQTAEEPVPPDADVSESPSPSPTATESVSILRPDIAPPAQSASEETLASLEAVIGFPEGGSELSEEALTALETILASPQMEAEGPITLSAHSDSNGTDAANLAASEERGLAVADWFIEEGVDPDRITVIAFGEQNPAEPNARDDGSPNEAGRAANRRVEVEVQTIALTVSKTDGAEAAEASAEAGD